MVLLIADPVGDPESGGDACVCVPFQAFASCPSKPPGAVPMVMHQHVRAEASCVWEAAVDTGRLPARRPWGLDHRWGGTQCVRPGS